MRILRTECVGDLILTIVWCVCEIVITTREVMLREFFLIFYCELSTARDR